MTESAPARRYDNSTREAQAAGTRERIIAAGAELLRESSIRDWAEVTVRSVAERAGVHERTLYRHFGTDKGLRDAVMGRLEEEAGVDLDALSLEDVSQVAARVLRFASSYPTEPAPPLDPTLHEADTRRRLALLRVVEERTAHWDAESQVRAAAVIDLLWSFSSFERLRTSWGLDGEEAINVIEWGIEMVIEATNRGRE